MCNNKQQFLFKMEPLSRRNSELRIQALILFFVLWAIFPSTAFKYKPCGNQTRAILVDYLDVVPSPVKIHGPFNVSARIIVKEIIGSDVQVAVSIRRLVHVFKDWEVPIPCVGGHGSCTYKPCEMLIEDKSFCDYFPKTVPCICPLQPGIFAGNDQFWALPDSKPLFSLLAEGRYKMELHVTDPYKRKQLGCVQIWFDIENGPILTTSLPL